jgi:hypothetical protein
MTKPMTPTLIATLCLLTALAVAPVTAARAQSQTPPPTTPSTNSPAAPATPPPAAATKSTTTKPATAKPATNPANNTTTTYYVHRNSDGKLVGNASVTVPANFTPEEKEDDALNQHTAYAFGQVTDTNCQKVIDTYQADLIPMAEKAQFPKNKAKFLFIAHNAIDDCQMSQGRYIEAEQSFRDALAEADVWPGKDDTQYPILWFSMSAAQMKQDHWEDAEMSATHSADLYQERIEAQRKAAAKAAADAGAEVAKQGPKVQAAITREAAEEAEKSVEEIEKKRAEVLGMLAAYYIRSGDFDASAKTIEQAYKEAVAGKLEGEWRTGILEIGAHVADLRGDSSGSAKWAARADTSPPPSAPPPAANTAPR